MLKIEHQFCKLDCTDFNNDEKAFIIANKDLIEKFVSVNMTYAIANIAESRDEILVCRAMREQAIELMDLFNEANKLIKDPER